VSSSIGIASYRDDYDDKAVQKPLIYNHADEFKFQRFQSPTSIKKALRLSDEKKYYVGKDGRKGYVSSKKLGGDWVLARSEQVAVKTTTRAVLQAYLNGALQEKWNKKEVLKCIMSCKSYKGQQSSLGKELLSKRRTAIGKNTGKYYQQDLVLKSQRIITSKTGIMKYTQTIAIDQIGSDNFCAIIKLQDDAPSSTATRCKPFDSLLVHVGLVQDGDDVKIYANGVMKVNRKVVPNLIVFDASGIAGSMAGKGTLWLAAHFEEKRRKRLKM